MSGEAQDGEQVRGWNVGDVFIHYAGGEWIVVEVQGGPHDDYLLACIREAPGSSYGPPSVFHGEYLARSGKRRPAPPLPEGLADRVRDEVVRLREKARMAEREGDTAHDQGRVDRCDGQAHAWDAAADRLAALLPENKGSGGEQPGFKVDPPTVERLERDARADGLDDPVQSHRGEKG